MTWSLTIACRFQDFTTITVNVLDVNDHFPVFNSSIYYICKFAAGISDTVCVCVCVCGCDVDVDVDVGVDVGMCVCRCGV